MNTLTCFSLSITDHVAHLVLNRPEAMNTMHPTFWRELDEVLAQLNKAGEARALVISSTGKHFSAGMALETFGGAITMDDQSPEGRAAIFDLLTDMQATFTRIESLRIPVIMAIHGGCIGGAVDMVTAACIRYATADTFFCIQEINIGMVADVGTLQRLPKLIPLGVVKELAYTGRRKSAAMPVPSLSPPTYDDGAATAHRLKGMAHQTPVLRSTTADDLLGAQLFFKCENLQRTGAFKFRGAFNTLAQFTDEQRERGVLAFSAGNHAQAIALS